MLPENIHRVVGKLPIISAILQDPHTCEYTRSQAAPSIGLTSLQSTGSKNLRHSREQDSHRMPLPR